MAVEPIESVSAASRARKINRLLAAQQASALNASLFTPIPSSSSGNTILDTVSLSPVAQAMLDQFGFSDTIGANDNFAGFILSPDEQQKLDAVIEKYQDQEYRASRRISMLIHCRSSVNGKAFS